MKAIEIAREELFRERSEECVEAESGGVAPGARRSAPADALVRACESAQAAACVDGSGGDAIQVVVHVDLDELPAEAPPKPAAHRRCAIDAGPALSREMARRLACDASVVTLVERAGEPLSVGRKTRSIPPAIRRALRARDGCCRFPGCDAERFIDAHHVKHWADGGETSLSNLVSLCRHHHRLIHDGPFVLEAPRDGDLVFRDRFGQPLAASPPLHPVEPHTVRLPVAAGEADSARNRHRLGPSTPRSVYSPLDLELTMWVLLANRDGKARGASRTAARAGPADTAPDD